MILYALGFLFCLGLLFYFIAKYKENDSPEEDFIWDGESQPQEEMQEESKQDSEPEQEPVKDFIEEAKEEENTVQQVQRLFAKTDSLPLREIFDLKDRVKDFTYNLEENRLLEEKHYTELKNIAAGLEKRLATFENDYLNNLYPTLNNLIKELENLQNKYK